MYRITFNHQGKFIQLHAKSISHSPVLLGFLEAKDFIFPNASKIIVEPNEEKVKEEFSKISTTFIPVNMVSRIDMVPMVENDTLQENLKENLNDSKVVHLHPKS